MGCALLAAGLLLIGILYPTDATTHWRRVDKQIVNQKRSPFALARPHAFMDLYEQEVTVQELLSSTQEMNKLGEALRKRESQDDPMIEEKLMRTDVDCRIAKSDVPLKTSFFVSEYPLGYLGDFVDHIKVEVQAHAPWEIESDELKSAYPDNGGGPNCKLYKLDYSPYAFDHLEAMQNRRELFMDSISLEYQLSIDKLFLGDEIALVDPKRKNWNKESLNMGGGLISTDKMGRMLQAQMKHSNEAVREMVTLHIMSVLWWMRAADANNAMECMRTTLHYANTHHLMHHSNIDWRPMVLLLFGNLLTVTQQYDEAAIVLELARHSARTPAQRAFASSALADVYALSANFTMAIPLYQSATTVIMEVDSKSSTDIDKKLDRTLPIRKRAALLCNTKIREELEAQYENLKEYLTDGEKYSSGSEKNAAIANRIKSRRADRSVVQEDSLIYDQAVYGWNPYRECRIVTESRGDRRAKLRCMVTNPQLYETSMAGVRARASGTPPKPNNTVYRVVPVFARDRSYPRKLEPFVNMEMDEGQIPVKYPLSPSELDKVESYWRRADWPSAAECEALLFHSDLSKADAIPQMFMSPEDKGYILADLLTTYIGLEMAGEHPLPWEEPFCRDDIAGSRYLELQAVNSTLYKRRSDKYAEAELKGVLQRLAEKKIHEAEMGQRIRTLIENNIGPRWISRNLAGLYWRVVGYPAEATKCLVSAVESTDQFRDVGLFQLGQVVWKATGQRRETELAYTLALMQGKSKQPQSYYLLGRLHLVHNQVDKAVSRLKDALDRDPFDYQVANDLLSVVCRGQPSKLAVRERHPTICCSPTVQNAVCFKGSTGEHCYVLEREGDADRFVYNRCNRVYTGQSHKPYPLVYLLAPFLPIFNTASKSERHFLAEEPDGVQTIQTQEIPLDHGGADAYYNHRAPDWYHNTRRHLVYEVVEEEKDEIELDVDYEQPPIPHKPLSLLWINNKSEMLKYDVPLPELLPRPSASLIRQGLTTFPRPRASPGLCGGVPKIEALLDNQVSTWLSVSAKGADVERYIDLHSLLPRSGHSISPECPAPRSASPFLTLDHLPYSPLSDQFLFYKPEKALTDALLAIGRKETIEGMGARLGQAMRMAAHAKDEAEMWLPAVVSALYWRVRGDSQRAVACLRLALAHAPLDMRDVALVSLANVCHQAGLLHSALITAGAALDVSPNLVAIHFTIANIYASIGDFGRALDFYYSTIALQSSFDPAKERIRSIFCFKQGEKYDLNSLL